MGLLLSEVNFRPDIKKLLTWKDRLMLEEMKIKDKNKE